MKYMILIALTLTSVNARAESDENVAKMRGDKNGISRVKDWGTTEQSANYWFLHQVDNGSALFHYNSGGSSKEYTIAVKTAGMKNPPRKGNPLTWFVDCVKFRKVIDTTDRDGLPMTIISFEPAKCVDGRD